MILYVNRNTNELTRDKSMGVPVSISTEIKLPIYEEIDDTDAMILNGKKIYVNKFGEHVDSDVTITKLNKKIKPKEVIGIPSDEDIFDSITEPNIPYVTKVKKYHITKLNRDNYHQFELNDIIHQELLNILNDSQYDFIMSEFDLKDDSSLESYNHNIMVMDKADYAHIEIENSCEEICIGNIPKGISIYVNGQVPYEIAGNRHHFKLSEHRKIDINIINSANKKINIQNMFILY